MARKHLGNGTVSLSATETTIYVPSVSNLTGTIGNLVFFNTSSSAQITVIVYGPHTGSAGNDDIVEEFVLNPRKSHVCREMVNAVCDSLKKISCQCDTAAVLSYNCSGDES